MTELVTHHRLLVSDARDLRELRDDSVNLVVTSPPYPMVAMWDALFSELSPAVATALEAQDFDEAFESMHAELDRVWAGCHRVLAPGGLACINVGDATRTAGTGFRLFSNHARTIQGLGRAGLTPLPDILWRKPTNAPNKFMGSGMLPAGAYVTYEHEYILIFRKGGLRAFASDRDKSLRRRSAFFWEERNEWFSDIWSDVRGARQDLADRETLRRSAAFPFEVPFRLIQMHSVYGDVVLDPFAGTGTTMVAALASGRSSIGIERDPALRAAIERSVMSAGEIGKDRAAARLEAHRAFVEARRSAGRLPEHQNRPHGFPVVTSQEADLELCETTRIEKSADGVWTAGFRTAGGPSR